MIYKIYWDRKVLFIIILEIYNDLLTNQDYYFGPDYHPIYNSAADEGIRSIKIIVNF